jgi:RimJ/RimL family protein N-acetyltransferase
MIAPSALVGERLELRPMCADDMRRFSEWTMDPEVMVPVSGGRLFTYKEEVAWFAEECRNPERLQYTIVVRDDGKIIGSCGIMGISTLAEQGVELGILIGDKTAWGKGYAKETLDLLAAYAHDVLGAPRVFLKVDVNHERAHRAYKKAGFEIVETVPAPDRAHGGGASYVMDKKSPGA